MALEYRVRWRRDGQWTPNTRIYQKRADAERKARNVLAMEAVKHDTVYDDMRDLAEPPVVEQRVVGEWEVSTVQPDPPSPEACEDMQTRYAPRSDDSYGLF